MHEQSVAFCTAYLLLLAGSHWDWPDKLKGACAGVAGYRSAACTARQNLDLYFTWQPVFVLVLVFVFVCVFLTVFEATNCTTLSFLIWHSHPMHHQTIKSIIFVSGVMFKLRCPDVSA